MRTVCLVLLTALGSGLRSQASLHIENAALRHQLAVLQRQARGRPRLRPGDRLFWAWLSRLWPGWRQALVIVKPDTVLRWHRHGFREAPLYELERSDIDRILETFDVLKRKDVRNHGDYRTKLQILEIYDAMERAIDTGIPYQTLLDPPPADPCVAHTESTRPARLTEQT